MVGSESEEFDVVWLRERVAMDIERLMRVKEMTRAGVANLLGERGCGVDAEWIDALLGGKFHLIESAELLEVFYAVRRRDAQ